jgi:biopolymer transport protein ExbD
MTDRHQHTLDGSGEVAFEKKERGARRPMDEGALNINSMMDIMTILLVFLLASISADPWNKKQDTFFTFAESTQAREPEDSLSIQITKKAIFVDDDEVVKVRCVMTSGSECRNDDDYKREGNRYEISRMYKKDKDANQYLIEKLQKVLTEKVKNATELYAAIAKKNAAAGKKGKAKNPHLVTILSDRDIPYRIIAEIVYSAGNAGIDQLRFAVMNASSR